MQVYISFSNQQATNILDGLVEEDDEVIEVWYILGWMNYIQGDEYKLNAHYYLKKAKKVINFILYIVLYRKYYCVESFNFFFLFQVSVKLGIDDLDYISHIDELLKELEEAYPLELEEEGAEELNSDISSDSEDENKMET